MYKRSTYIPLNNDSLDVLANTSITVKVYNIKARKAELAPVDTKKGAPIPPLIVDEVDISMHVCVYIYVSMFTHICIYTHIQLLWM
jgi:hypothetical protein